MKQASKVNQGAVMGGGGPGCGPLLGESLQQSNTYLSVYARGSGVAGTSRVILWTRAARGRKRRAALKFR